MVSEYRLKSNDTFPPRRLILVLISQLSHFQFFGFLVKLVQVLFHVIVSRMTNRFRFR